jgi:hypothetical protein
LVGLFVLPFGLCTLVHFGPFSSLNIMMRSSPARSRKKNTALGFYKLFAVPSLQKGNLFKVFC